MILARALIYISKLTHKKTKKCLDLRKNSFQKM